MTFSEPDSDSLKSFFVMFIGQAISLVGSRLVQFALVWWLTKQTGSVNILAFASIMAILPQAILGPFAGVLVDRWNRKRVMMVADSGIAFSTLILAFLYASNQVEILHIYLLMFIRSIGGAFHWASMQASTSLMVPKEQMARVAGLNQSISGIAGIVAPPLGALLMDILPIQHVLAIDVSTALFAVTPLFFIHVPQPQRIYVKSKSILEDLRGGLDYIFRWRGLLIIMGMVLVINLLISPAFSLLPLLITDYFKGGVYELALIQSSLGLGMIVGGLVLSVWGGFKSRIKTAFTALIFASLGILVFSQTPSTLFLVAVASIFVFGVMNSIANSSFFAALQTLVPPHVQGRVFTLIMASSTIAQPVGLAIAGPVAEYFSIRSWFLVGGISFLVMTIIAFSTPAVIKFEETTPPHYE